MLTMPGLISIQKNIGPPRWRISSITREDVVDPSYRIIDLDNSWDYAHVQSPRPYGYKIKQEAGSGIITAEKQETLYYGRSNAADGYIIYQVPEYADANNTKILARFGNQGEGIWELRDAMQ